jgi:hypothetical protein
MKTEPFCLILRPDSTMNWLPSSLGDADTPLMDIATSVYNMKGSAMINHCRLFLQVISLYDLLKYDLSGIHPLYFQGEIPPSC